ncbi:MAG: carboxypeptidase-like regulatory domain-containing protein, partial [Pyrinomonadaceae bacterium]
MQNLKLLLLIGLITFFTNSFVFAQQAGSLGGQVFDSLGNVVVGATVAAVDGGGKEKTTVTNRQGEFSIAGLAPGTYTVRVIAAKFALYENTEVVIASNKREELTVALTVEAVQEEVEISSNGQISTDADNNASATVLKGADLEALPDDPDELEAALQALAGPSAGPNGGQIY